MATKEEVYAEWPDGRGNLIRLVSQEWKGGQVVHLRRYWQPGGPGADWVPTRVGIMMDEEQLRELERGIREAREKLEW